MKQDWTRAELNAYLREIRDGVTNSAQYEALTFCMRMLVNQYPEAHRIIK